MHLQDVRRSGSGWIARCPAHDDQRASLSVGVGEDGRTLLWCQATCDTSAVVAALGLTMRDLAPPAHPNPESRRIASAIVATYPYVDEAGGLLFEVVRYEPKSFSQRRPDGKGGWLWKLGDVRRVLYRLPELLAAGDSEPILIVEGEADVDALRAVGFVATCNAGGAGKWRPEYGEALRGRHLVILPDNDDPGEQHAATVAAALAGVAESVRVLRLPGLPPKGDVSDWLCAGGTADELRALLTDAPSWAPRAEPVKHPGGLAVRIITNVITAADLIAREFPEPRWAVPGIVPDGVTLLAGAPKRGKSWLLLNIAVAIASGGYALGKVPVEQGEVLLLSLEDTARRLQDRLLRVLDGEPAPAGLHFATEWPRADQGGIEELDTWLAGHPETRLVGVDVLARIRAPSGRDASLYSADYAALAAIKQIADAHGVPLMAVHHTRKAGADDPFDTISGTNGTAGAADTALVLTREIGRADASLYLRGRDVPEAEHALGFDDVTCRWTLLGDAAEFRLTENRAAIIEALRIHGPLKPALIADALKANRATIRSTLSRMAKAGQIVERGGEYSLPAAPPATPATPATPHAMTPIFGDESATGGATPATGGHPKSVAPTEGVQQGCNRKTHVTTPTVAPVAPVAPGDTRGEGDIRERIVASATADRFDRATFDALWNTYGAGQAP